MTILLTADFKTNPFLHQLKEFEGHAEDRIRALLWHMRTGKSKLIVDTACHLFSTFEIDAVLLFAPNGVHENWIEREFPAHTWSSVLTSLIAWRTEEATSAQRSKVGELRRIEWYARFTALLANRSQLVVFTFNSESMTRPDVRRAVARVARCRRCLLVFDESQDYRTPGSSRSMMAKSLSRRCPYRRILTGTAVHNSPLHAWSQYELLERGALGFARYDNFEKHHAEFKWDKTRSGRRYRKLVGYKDLDGLRRRMSQYSSVVRREDCGDMPNLVRREREIRMSDEQRRIYRELHASFIIELEEGVELSIGERAARLGKLQQVASGFLVDEYGDVHDVPGSNPRLDALSDEVYLAPGKVIVWCRFRQDIDRTVARLRADGHRVLEYHGRTPALDKALAREMFAPGAENDAKALVGYPVNGLNFSAASEVVWYSHVIGDAVTRCQADDRATAIGGRNVLITDFVAAPVDRYALSLLSGKTTTADDLAGSGMKEILEEVAL